MSYRAPVKDMLFAIKELADIDAVAALPGFEEAGYDTAAAVLEEAAKFSEGVLAPLNWEGDKNPSSWKDGVVTTTPGFKQAFAEFGAGGWQGLQHPTDFGGQGLPKTIGAACIEMINSANMSFALCPLLTDGAIEALLTAGSPEQQQTYIPKMVSGQWTGTMNLTEPQAGSDLAAVRTRAEPQPDGTLQDLRHQDLHHLRRARHGREHRAPGAGARDRRARRRQGHQPVRRAQVPGQCRRLLGARNDVHCVSIEHKLGIKASPTAVLQFGDHGGAIGTLVGQENQGLAYMFVMMNAARYAVGMQGVAVAERAYQKASTFARERVQSRPVDGSTPGAAPIIHHPDVKRMLMTMRAYTEGCRAMAHGGRGRLRRRACAPRCRGAQAEPGLLRIHGAAGQGLQHRDEPGGHQPGRAGARRHGLHRGDRRGAVLPRRAHPADLRRHHRDPGQRPGRPQDGARRRRGGARHRRRRSRPPKANCSAAAATPPRPCSAA